MYKLTLFPLVVSVIKKATSIDEQREIMIRSSRKKGAQLKAATSYALVARVGKKKPIKIRVIVIKIGAGKLIFRSVMKD